MLRSANRGEKLQSAQFLQLIEEDVPGTFKPTGVRHILTCLKGEVQPEEAWDSFRPDGVHEDAWAALSKEHVLYTAQIRWDYAQQYVLARMLFGIDETVRAVSSGSGYIEEQFALAVHDARPLQTYTLEYGQPKSCSRHTYAVLVSINRNHDRDGQNIDGQLVLMARRAEAYDVPMTGGSPQNAVLTINANNVSGNGVFAIQAPGAAAENVTLHIGDSTATVKAAFEALNSLAGVTVTGAVATSSGELHILTASGATGNATIYDTIVVTPGMTAAALQTAIRALGGSYANVTVTGAVSAVGNGPDLTTGGTAIGSLHDGADPAGLFNGGAGGAVDPGTWVGYNFGTPKTFNKVRLNLIDTGLYPAISFKIQVSDTGAFNGEESTVYTYTGGPPNSGAPSWFDVTFASQTKQYLRYLNTSGTIVSMQEIQAVASTVGNGAYNIAFPSAVGNVTDITSAPGTGWSTSVTQAGNAAGSYTVTVSDPGNTSVTIAPVSGTGWSGAVTQAGNDGRIRIPARVPILPQHFGIRVADARDGLAGATLAAKVKRAGISFDNLIEGVWFAQEGNTTFQSHADSDERSVTLTMLVAVDSPLALQLQSDARQTPSKPRWYEIRDVSGNANNFDKTQCLASVSAARPFSAAGKVRAIEATLKLVLDDLPFTENLIRDGGASLYFITRRAN
jgi:hypothetical protein